jgi:hypothetical protein
VLISYTFPRAYYAQKREYTYDGTNREPLVLKWPPHLIRGCDETNTFKVEIKPRVGDDFPSVLRQMRVNRADVLLIDQFDAAGATLEQVRKMFATSGYRIVMLAEIEARLP